MKIVEYYLMRHAPYYDQENQYVTYYGMLRLKNSIDNLLTEITERFPNKKLRIIHSTLPRAKHTALLMEEMLFSIRTFKRSDTRLNYDKLQIDEDYINEVVGLCEKENEICLILSHQPDIEFYCKKKLETAEYIRRSTDLQEKSDPKRSDTDDDLPF